MAASFVKPLQWRGFPMRNMAEARFASKLRRSPRDWRHAFAGAWAHVNSRAKSRVARCRHRAYPRDMADDIPDDPHSAAARIDAAIARIEGAIAGRAAAADALARRHEALKARMAEAVAALDDVIARGSAT